MKWLIIFLLSSLVFLSPSSVSAIECGDPIPTKKTDESSSEYEKRLSDYEKECKTKIASLQQEQGTLNAAISTINSKISLARAQIAQTEAQINALEEEIDILSTLVTDLNFSLDDLSATYVARVRESYKQRTLSSLHLLFSSQSFSEFLEKARYLSVVKARDHLILVELEKARADYDNQKQLKEEKQAEVETLMAGLEAQRRNLNTQKSQKQRLLTITKNSEKEYQSLMAEAQREIRALKGFSESRGSNCLTSVPNQPDGWFWSQRDPRWCNQYIADSSYTIGEVGCYVSSVAMVWKKYGFDMTPSIFAQKLEHFPPGSAYMLWNPSPAPPGYNFHKSSYNSGTIDAELSAGRVVIVHFNLGGDGHFVVIKSGSGGNYVINDPWYGPDMSLNENYSVSNIDSMRLFN